MAHDVDASRRRFLGTAAMTIAATHLGVAGISATNEPEQRQSTAFDRADQWLNSPRLTAASLQGKVVLVDFWTYTCINWLRTLPYVRAWAQKYRQGLVLIGVHTPEFPFERNLDNVRRAVQQMGIEYPVVIDNDYAIWRAFDNHYWPALYFLDPQGKVRHHHFGEGEYEQSERAIQRLLADAGAAGGAGLVSVEAAGVEAPADWDNLKSPENYLGYQRTERFASPGGAEPDRRRRYAAPTQLALNQWALAGDWTMGAQAIVSGTPGARIVYRFHARDLHLVMGPPRRERPVRFRVSIDGQPPAAARGADVDADGTGTVVDQRL
jgi:thiol-disulfide isomerase/thioredoxin